MDSKIIASLRIFSVQSEELFRFIVFFEEIVDNKCRIFHDLILLVTCRHAPLSHKIMHFLIYILLHQFFITHDFLKMLSIFKML